MPSQVVCRVEDVPPSGCKLVEFNDTEVGIFNVHGEYIAVGNICPHAYAPVCLGRHGGTTMTSAPGEFPWGREGEILACPWHGWEFDLRTGRALADRHKRLRLYTVTREGDELVLSSARPKPESSRVETPA